MSETDGRGGSDWAGRWRGAIAGLEKIVPAAWRKGVARVPVVRLSGAIGMVTPLRPGLGLAALDKPLERAFTMSGARAVALAINSPGGSPVQSHLIYQRIRQLATQNDLPVIAFVEDVAASGGYMVACAADEIYCDPSSVVGSIGVVSASFGFQDAIARLGIERRLYTAGERKAQLDPFLPQDEREVAHLKTIQQDIHRHFIALVRERRGAKLSGSDGELFSGEFWAGGQAVTLGLADGVGELKSLLRSRFGDDVLMPVVSGSEGLFARLLRRRGMNAAGAFAALPEGPGLGREILSTLEERALWLRLGL